MSQQTLTALSQRDEAFWIGLGLMVLGAILARESPPDTLGVGEAMAMLGTLIIVTRIVVAVWRILRTTVLAGRLGYAEGVAGDDPDHDADDEERTTLTE